MSKSLEKNLWASAYKALRYLVKLHITRIENAVGSGTPDVEGCFNGVQFWWELKVGSVDKKGNVKVSFRPTQIPWLKRRCLVGGKAFAIIKIGREKFCLPGPSLSMFQGEDNVSLDQMRDASICAGNASWVDILAACVSEKL